MPETRKRNIFKQIKQRMMDVDYNKSKYREGFQRRGTR